MTLMILADEGLNGNIVRELRDNGFQVDWVLEVNPGISDEEVIALAKQQKQTLITEDKDFGEWIFAHKVEGLTVIFLRYEKADYSLVVNFLIELLQDLAKSSAQNKNEFITINKNKVRRRKI